MNKTCTSCGDHKPLEAFAPQRGGLHGRSSKCRVCRKDYFAEYNRRRYLENQEYRERQIALSRERASLASERVKELLAEIEHLTTFGTPQQCEELADTITYSEQFLNATIDEFANQWLNVGRDPNL